MKRLITSLTIVTLSLMSFQSMAAVKVVECEDEEGNRSFQSACPPGSTVVDEKRILTGEHTADKAVSADVSATLYSIPECDSCDGVREFLQNRGIAITEKSVNEDIENQNELSELTGTLKVPATVIGEKVVTGYNRSELMAALEAAGYQEKKTEAE
jgi:glutaredoxin